MYRLTSTSCVERLSDGALIPPDPNNTDWAEYQKWLAEGNAPLPDNTQERIAALRAKLIK